MKQKLRRFLSTLLALTMVLSFVPTSAFAAESDVKYGSIVDGAWTETPGATGAITTDLPEGVSKVSKQAVKTADNEYQVTLTVEMTETTTITPPDAVATVLVMDTSGSMGWCAKCGQTCTCGKQQWVAATTIDTGKTYYIQNGDGYREVQYCDGKHNFIVEFNCDGGAGWYTGDRSWDHTATAKITPKTDETPDGTQFYERQAVTVPTRLDGAKAAAIDFLKSYSGFSDDSFETNGNVKSTATNSITGRYVALVKFATLAETTQRWVDVATVNGYQAVFNQINGLSADGGTNLDAGLHMADLLLKDTTVSSVAAKNVIALTDGEPTYYLKKYDECDSCWSSDITIDGVKYCYHGNGSSCNSATFTATVSSATAVKTNATLYTICFGAGTKTLNDPDTNATITLANYLREKIATPAADGKTYAYTADNSAQLSAAFKAISSTITAGLSSGTVTDSLPSAATAGTGYAANWPLTKETASSKTTEGNTTTYTWTKSYTVTLDPEQTNGEDYYPLNGQTQLVVDGTTIDFPIPAGRVTYPKYSTTYSWTGADQLKDGEATLPTGGSDYATEDAAKASVDTEYTSTTWKAGTDGYYYQFSGWTAGTTADYVVPFTGSWTKTNDKVDDMWAKVTYVAGENGKIKDGETTSYEVLKGTAWSAAGITDPETVADAGYKFDGWSEKPETITNDVTITGSFSIDEDQTHEISYTVEYYKDNVRVDADTQTVKQTVQILQNTLTVNKSAINTSDKYIGYKLDSSATGTIPDTIADKGVIKVYYVKDDSQTKDLSYTVQYYKDGVIVSSDTQTETQKVWINAADTLTVDSSKINTSDKYIGYKFDHSDPETIPSTVNNGDVIKVYYVKDDSQTKDLSYTVQYYKDGVIVSSDTQTETQKVWINAADTLTVDSSKINTSDKYIGYKFDHSDPEAIPTTVNDGDVIKVYYTSVTYKINYELNGGTVATANPTTYTVNTDTFTLNNPTRTGYTFTGWTGTGLDKVTETVTVVKGSTGDRTYIANWEADTATIKFVTNGGTAVADKIGVTDEEITDTAMPTTTRDGYDFEGWYANSDLSGAEVKALPAKFPAGTTIYYAKWTATVTAVSKELVTSAPAGLNIPTGTTITYPDGKKISADVGDQVTLLYKITVTGGAGASFTVTEDSDNTTLIGGGATQYGKVYTGTVGENGKTEFYVAKTFTITGEADEKLSNSVTVSTTGVTPTGPDDVEVEIKKYDVTYTWTGDVPTGVTLPTKASYKAGDEVDVADAPEAEGYVFSGWTTTDVRVADGKFNMPKQAVSFTGTWDVDNWNDDPKGEDSETGGDDIPDKYQVLVKYEAGTGGKIKSGAKTLEVITLTDDDGEYVTSGTVNATGSEAEANDNYAFTKWTQKIGEAAATDTELKTATGPIKLENIDGGTTVVFTACFAASTPIGNVKVPYKVEHYQEQSDGTYVIVSADTETRFAEKGTTITLTDADYKTYEGYVADKKVAGTTLSGKVDYSVNGNAQTVTLLTLKLYYSIDRKGGGEDGKEPDTIPDKYQAFVYYVSADTSKGTVKPTFEKIDLMENGAYVERANNVKAKGSEATPEKDNAFDYWTKQVGTADAETVALAAKTGEIDLGTVTGNTEITFKAYFDTDVIGEKDPDDGDGTPDKYQATVIYQVKNGTWDGTDTAAKKSVFTLYEKSAETGKWEKKSNVTLGDTIPTGMVANTGYTSEGGGWNSTIDKDTVVSEDMTYTYTFLKIGSATFNPNEAPFTEDDATVKKPIFYKKLTGILPTNETFTITLTEEPAELDSDPGNIEVKPGTGIVVVEPAEYTGTVTMSGAGRVAFDCDLMSFDQPGTYIFTVTENEGDKSYITYSGAEYQLCITVGYSVNSASADEQESEKTAQLEVLYWFIQGGDMKDEGQLEATFTNTSSYTPIVPAPVVPKPTVSVKGLDTVNHVAYIVGRDNGLVDPNGTITRAEVATIYFRLMTEEFRQNNWSDECSYTDVADTAWYNVAIATLEKAGVIKDTATGGSFRPNEPITRAELAVMAAQFATVTGTIPATSFSDVPSTYWAAKEIALVEFAGWIEGYQGKFRPDDNLTRAECVTIVNRMLNRGAEAENMLDDMVTFPDNPVVNKKWYYEAIQEAANSHTWTRTNKLLTGEHFNGEKWTTLQTAPDWAAMEQAWANANRK